MDILNKLPEELKCKVISYHERPPHYYAIKNGLFPIRDALLMYEMSGQDPFQLQMIDDELFWVDEDFVERGQVLFQPLSHGWFD